jgi:hypothetical protein
MKPCRVMKPPRPDACSRRRCSLRSPNRRVRACARSRLRDAVPVGVVVLARNIVSAVASKNAWYSRPNSDVDW